MDKKDAEAIIGEEEVRQVSKLKDSYPWPAVHNDLLLYMMSRQLREATNMQREILEKISEHHDQLYENKALYRTTLALARKEKYFYFQNKKAEKKADYERVSEKVVLAWENYKRRKADLLTQIDNDITDYKKLVAQCEKDRIAVKKQKLSNEIKEKWQADFTKLRSKYLDDLNHHRNKFLKIRRDLSQDKIAVSQSEQYKKHMTEYLSSKSPPSRRAIINKRVIDTLHGVQMNKEYLSRYASQLSGGQQQRIGIARAIAVKPKLLVADEPISSLDVSIQAQVVNIIKDLNEQEGLSVLFIAHDLRMVRYISDRIAVMHRGRIVETGLADEVYNHAKHPYTQNLLRAVPSIERLGESLSSKQKVDFVQDDDHDFFWYWLSPSHKILATDAEVSAWNLQYVRKEASNYMVGK